MFSYYFQGLALGAAMILPLGPQNAFVMNQGIRRQYHIMIALLCAISDLVLICAGIFGGSALLMQSPWLLALGSLGGQLDVEPKRWFALGTISASFLWFFGLAILAAWLAPRLRTAKSQRIINLVVGCVMWFIALQLARDGIAHAQALFS
ncbi:LysE family transporter [Shigella dysenteriae]